MKIDKGSFISGTFSTINQINGLCYIKIRADCAEKVTCQLSALPEKNHDYYPATPKNPFFRG
jgi:hypothetical protein